MDVPGASETSDRVLETMEGAVIADRSFFESALSGVLAWGHVLLEDIPGTGKTLTARSLATVALRLQYPDSLGSTTCCSRTRR